MGGLATSNRRAIRLLAAGGLVSGLGDMAAITALSYVIYRQTGSAVWLGFVYVVNFGVTGLLNPLAGTLADRLDRRRLLIACELLSAALFVALAFASQPLVMVLVMLAASVVGAPIFLAFAAAVPNLVGPEDLSWANSLASMAGTVGRTVGPALGGFLVVVIGGRGVFAFDAATFVVLAATTWLATGRYMGERDDSDSRERWSSLAGFRHIAASSVLLPVVAAWTIMFFAVDIAFVADAPLAKLFGAGSMGFGLITSLWGVGSVIGALAARRLSARAEGVALLAGTFGVTVGYAFVAFARHFPMVLGGEVVAGFTDNYGGIAGTNVVQRTTPDAIRGRVFGAIGMAGMTANIPAFLLGGLLVGPLGSRGVYLLGAALALPAGLVMLSGVRALGHQPRPQLVQ
jgi:MFS family permease